MSLKRVNFSPLHTIVRDTVKNTFQPVTDGFGAVTYQLVETAANLPAFAWNPSTGESLGLSIEEARTNYIANTITPTFLTAGSGISVTSRVETVKGVSCTVFNVVQTGFGGIYFTPAALPAASNCNPSFFIKNITNAASVQCRDSTDPINGDITFTGIPSDGEFHRVGVGISAATVSAQYNTNTITTPSLYLLSGSTREFEVCMPMMEVGTNTSSLILTSGSTVTRLADVVTVPDLSGWFNPSEGTFVIEFERPHSGDQSYRILSLGTSGNRVTFTGFPSFDSFQIVRGLSPSVSADYTSVGPNDATKFKLALSYIDRDKFVLSINGAAPLTLNVSTNTQGIVGPIYLGSFVSGNQLNGTIANIQYYPQAVSDAQLQELSVL